MRHEAGDVPLFVADASNIIKGPVWICAFRGLALSIYVTPEYLVISPKFRECFLVGEKTAFAMGDRHAQDFFEGNLVCERCWFSRRRVRNGIAASGCE